MIQVNYMYKDKVIMSSSGKSPVIPVKGDLVKLFQTIYVVDKKLIMFDNNTSIVLCYLKK